MALVKTQREAPGVGQLSSPRFSEGGAGPKILVEHPDPVTRDAVTNVLAEAGYRVATCSGPRASTPATIDRRACPLLEGAVCTAVATADIIVTGLSLDQTDESLVVSRLRAAAQDTPIILECPRPSAKTHPAITRGLQRVFPLTFESLLRSVQSACDGQSEDDPR